MEKEKKDSVDVLNYYLNPKMEIVPKEKHDEILRALNAELSQLAKFQHNDPAVKALNAKPGDIVQIKRKDPTGEYIYYRTVV